MHCPLHTDLDLGLQMSLAPEWLPIKAGAKEGIFLALGGTVPAHSREQHNEQQFTVLYHKWTNYLLRPFQNKKGVW